MKKILTISVAAYNVQQFIRQCLDSLTAKETIEKIEVLVIDDGGNDQTLAIAREYEEKYPGTFFAVHKDNGGWGSTLNTGIAMAGGKYFKQLDGDDYFLQEKLSEFVEQLERTDADVVVTPWRAFDETSGETVYEKDPAAIAGVEYGVLYTADQLPDAFYAAMHGCTFKTEMLKANNVKLIEHAMYTDYNFVVQGTIYAKTFIFFPYKIYQYRLGLQTQSVSMASRCKRYKEMERAIQFQLEFLKKATNNPNTRFVRETTDGMIMIQYPVYFLLEPTEMHRKELRSFDRYIKENRFHVYKKAGRTLTVLRLTNYMAYKPLCRITQWRRRKAENGKTK